jgi:predicted Zn-dependent protease
MTRFILSLLPLVATLAVGCAPASMRLSDPEKLSLLLAEYPAVHDPTCASFLTQLITTATSDGATPMRVLTIDSPAPIVLTPQPGLVVVSKKLITVFENEGEVFFMLAHEVAHTELKHHERPADSFSSLWVPTRKEIELEADTVALQRLVRAGYAPHDAIAALKRAYELSAATEPAQSVEYPSLPERIEALLPQLSRLPSSRFLGAVSHREYQQCRANLLRGG